jgi:hypothetical protein
MNLTKRIFYYFGGFAIGLVLLYFFIVGSGASCEYDYGPNARTLKNIRTKKRMITEKSLAVLLENQLDTSAITQLLKNGDVLFSESNTELDSCKVYIIEGIVSEKNLRVSVENCMNRATVLDAEVN